MTRTAASPPRPGRAARVVRGIGTTFIVLGAIILYFVVYELVGTSLQTRSHQSALRQAFIEVLNDPKVRVSPTPTASPVPKPGKRRVTGIAQLIIPKLGIDDIVVEGVSLNNLAYGPGRYPDTAAIGGPGSTAIAGHRTGWGSPFLNLDDLDTGDQIILRTPRATYTYVVTRGNVVVTPNDYWVVSGDPQSKARSKLTLTTCTPKYTSKNRLIVWADLTKTEPRTP